MKDFSYKLVGAISGVLGIWFFHMISWIVSSCYFLLFPRMVSVSVQFYRALFPERSLLHHLRCTWEQYHNFSQVFIDRFILQSFDDISYTSEGWERLEEAANNETGGIILMSHMGNWEVAAHLLRRREMRMLLYMGEKQKEQIERRQKRSLEKSGIKIVAVSRDGGSPFDILEGINFLKDGGMISITGDRVWVDEQRKLPVKFLGHQAYLPETPHLLALLSGAPLYIFFAFRTGEKQYHFAISPPKYVKAPSRAQRKDAVKKSVQEYAALLEEAVRSHPCEWYHFEQFLGKRLD